MILVDTSVWIDYLTDSKTEAVAAFQYAIEARIPFGLAAIIYQELLQGARTERDLEQLDGYLSSQRFYHPRDGLETYSRAARLYARCRRRGVTIRSTIDCLIAQIAIDNDLLLLHDDRDFTQIAELEPELRPFHIPS